MAGENYNELEPCTSALHADEPEEGSKNICQTDNYYTLVRIRQRWHYTPPALESVFATTNSVLSYSEKLFGSSIGNRTTLLPTYREIGPPDLVHLSTSNRASQKEDGQYHYITGIDLSSTVAPQAYIQMLSLPLDVSVKHPAIFTYCSFNSFSKCDVRIKIECPEAEQGQFQLTVLPADRFQKTIPEVSETMWTELFVSCVVRSVIIGLGKERKFPGLVEKQLFQSKHQIVDLITKLVSMLPKGMLLGAEDTVQKPNLWENYLVDTLCYVVEVSGEFKHAIQRIQALPLDLTPIIARLLCLMDNEIDAIKYLNRAIKVKPRDSLLLNEQIKFLVEKDQPQLALQCALESVNCNPISFKSWYWLVLCHLLNDDLNSALIALNSTPMYAQRPRDYIPIDVKDSLLLPEPTEGKVQSVWDSAVQIFGADSENLLLFSPKIEVEAVDPALKRVNLHLLKGTHKGAYNLLVWMILKAGWDQVLKARAEVFIMDEEYKTMSTVTLHSQAKPMDIRKKRQCERWLDDLFLIIYDDLRITLIVENELNAAKQLKHSALEWELIGLTSYRTAHYKSVVPALRTTLGAKFDIVAALKLLKMWELHVLEPQANKLRWLKKDTPLDLTLTIVLEILIQVISYNVRFYNEFQLEVLLFLKKLCDKFDKDFIKNKIQVSFENDNDDLTNCGVIPPFDNLISILDTFDNS